MIRHGLLLFFKTRSPSLKTLGLTFLLNACLTRCWYNCPWHIVVMPFWFIMISCLYREQAHLASDSFVYNKILRDGISTSVGRTASMPQTKEYRVAPMEVRIEMQQAHKANGKNSCQSIQVSVIFTDIFFMFLLATSTAPFIWAVGN